MKKIRNGRIGELMVELELVKLGWHVQRLDGFDKAINADLMAMNEKNKINIQVKSNFSSNRLSMGRANKEIVNGRCVFNSVVGPIKADFVVAVSGTDLRDPKFHVFSVEEAEVEARKMITEWKAKPKKDGGPHGDSFTISRTWTEVQDHLEKWDLLENTD